MSKKNTYIEYLLPFFLLFSQYRISGISIATILLFFVAIITYSKHGFKFYKYFLPFVVFFIYAVFHDFFTVILGLSNSSVSTHRLLEYGLNFVLMIMVSSAGVNESKLYKIWKCAAIIYIGGLIFHLAKIYVYKQPVQIIEILPYLDNINTNEAMRPRSFFNEPSYLAEAILPLLFLALKRLDFKWAIITTFAIVASTSSMGILLMIVLWGAYYLLSTSELGKKRNPFIIILLAIGVIVFSMGGLYPNSGIFAASLYKFTDALKGGSTFDVRVTMGFIVVRNLPFHSFMIGTFYNELADFLTANPFLGSIGIISKYWEMGNSSLFLNAFCELIFRYGVIGLILYMCTYRNMLLNKHYPARMYAIMIFIGLFGNGYLLNAPYFVSTMLLLLYLREDCLGKCLMS